MVMHMEFLVESLCGIFLRKFMNLRTRMLLVESLCGIFLRKFYESEDTMRECAESALESIIGDLSGTYFVGNAPMGHMVVQPTEDQSGSTSYMRFLFKSQVIAKNKFNIAKCEDFVWMN